MLAVDERLNRQQYEKFHKHNYSCGPMDHGCFWLGVMRI